MSRTVAPVTTISQSHADGAQRELPEGRRRELEPPRPRKEGGLDVHARSLSSCRALKHARRRQAPRPTSAEPPGRARGSSPACSTTGRPSAWESAQPRARAQVDSSTDSAVRKTSRVSAEKTFHATITSHAGSPTPRLPQSMTALSRPVRPAGFGSRGPRGSRQARGATPGARGLIPTARSTVSTSIMARRRLSQRGSTASRAASGSPRKKLCSPGSGPFVRRSAAKRHELRRLGRQSARIGDGLHGRVLAAQPSIHGPFEGIALGGHPVGQRRPGRAGAGEERVSVATDVPSQGHDVRSLRGIRATMSSPSR